MTLVSEAPWAANGMNTVNQLISSHKPLTRFSSYISIFLYTVQLLNFVRDLISLISLVMKIRKIKYSHKLIFYIDSNSKTSRSRN